MDTTAYTSCGSVVWTSMLSRESPWSEKPPAMRTEVYWVPGPWPGRLGIIPRPRGGDWLADEVRAWRASGLDVVTSLLTPDEVAALELQEEETRAREEGLEFLAVPIPDYGGRQ